jgi:serpin B
MPRAFESGGADFEGMSPEKPLFILKVLHSAFVTVDEEGTKAAAATAFAIGCSAAPPTLPRADFRADHPFVFLIVDRETGCILFIGRVTDPR